MKFRYTCGTCKTAIELEQDVILIEFTCECGRKPEFLQSIEHTKEEPSLTSEDIDKITKK